MNKGIRLIKRFVALFLVLLLSIESFGAVVSDNDGSAFITKAEFDSLKNNFQSQVNQYNTSIDSKIDGAIASYLAGISMNKTKKYNLVFGDENTHFMKGVLNPEFRVPEMTYAVGVDGRSTSASNNVKQYGCSLNINYPADWATNETQRKPLVKLVEDAANNEEGNVVAIYWDGCALRYREAFTVGKTTGKNYADLACFDLADASKRVLAQDLLLFRDLGYKSDMTTQQIVSPTLTAQYRIKGDTSWGTITEQGNRWDYNVSRLSATLDEIGGKTRDHLHVVNYDNVGWEVYNEKFVRTLSLSSQQTLTEQDVYSTVNNTTYLKNSGYYVGVATINFAYGDMTFTMTTTTNKIASIGKLVNNYNSNEIYQFPKKQKFTFKKDWDVENLNLLQGMPAFGVEQNDQVEWDVYFKNIGCYTSDTTWEDNPEGVEVRIYVATTPFTTGTSIDTTKGKYIKFKDESNVEHEYIDTKNRKAKLKWDAEDKSFIYIKCIPLWSGTSYINKFWDIEMDLTGDYAQVTLKEQV